MSCATLNVPGTVVTAAFGSSQVACRFHVFPGRPADAAVNVNVTVTHDDSVATEHFGKADLGKAFNPTLTLSIYYENKNWHYVLVGTTYEIKWGLNSGNRYDVPNGAVTPFPGPAGAPESFKKAMAKADLTPNTEGLTSRNVFWSRALTERHELFHVSDWLNNYYPPKMASAKADIAALYDAVTVTGLDPRAQLNAKGKALGAKVVTRTVEAWATYNLDAEARAYLDGRAGYQDLADSIIP